MRFILSLFIFVSTGILLLGCDNSVRPNDPQPVKIDTVKVDTTHKIDTTKVLAKVQTCLDATKGSIPKGTYAKRLNTLQTAPLDSVGCFSFPTPLSAVGFAARSVAVNDSVIFYNDSALFSVTIPYLNKGDTIQVVPTVVSLRNVPNVNADTVFLAVFDKVHILERKVQLKRADYGTYSEYGRTLWSVDNGSLFQVHFEIHKQAVSPWASGVISAEPGGTITPNYVDIQASEVPRIVNVKDTIAFAKMWTNLLSSGDSTLGRACGDDYAKYITCGPMENLKIQATSIYGIAEIRVDNVLTDYLIPPEFDSSSEDIVNNPPYKTAKITVIDSAGYITSKTVKMWTDDAFGIEGISGKVSVTTRYRQWATRDSVTGYRLVGRDSVPETVRVNDHVKYFYTAFQK